MTTMDYAYTPNPTTPYGPIWRGRRPLGLPDSARQCSTSADGERILRSYLTSLSLHPALVCVLVDLARTESGCRLGRAANRFDVRPKLKRPVNKKTGKRKPYISAYGVFQWNRDCLRSETGDQRFPWVLTTEEEIAIPVKKYKELWDGVLAIGLGDTLNAARMIRLWHRSPSAANRFSRALKVDSTTAWARSVGAGERALIDGRLRKLNIFEGL